MKDEQIEALRTKYGFNRIGIIEGEMYLPIKDVFEKLGWIPCSERLPEEYTEVLGCDYEGNITIVELYKDNIFGEIWKQWNGGSLRLNVIIAWMPLPEPYQEEGEVHE
jgi:hypothetical protein